jgi:molybdenum cofactor cytidylyltransferase
MLRGNRVIDIEDKLIYKERVHMENISAIILAAGKSRRMGVNKLSLPYRGKPLIQHTLDLVREIDFMEYILVISPENARELGFCNTSESGLCDNVRGLGFDYDVKELEICKDIREFGSYSKRECSREKLHLKVQDKMRLIYNLNPERGQSYSVNLGVQEAKGKGYIFFTGDQPLLTVKLVEEIIVNATSNRIVFPLDENGNPSNPTFFGRDFREELLSVKGDEGGRQIRRKYPDLCYSFTPKNTKQLKDIDTVKDIENLL